MFGQGKNGSKEQSRAVANRSSQAQVPHQSGDIVQKVDEEIDSGYEADTEEESVIENPGAYMGYTMGQELPTLYFENGHYTQIHDEPENIGWHPNTGVRHFIKNVTEDAHAHYEDNRGKWDRKQKTAYGKQIEQGDFDAEEGEGMMMEGNVIMSQGQEKIYLHPSRGRLITPNDPAFNPKFGKRYALKVIRTGIIAENEA